MGVSGSIRPWPNRWPTFWAEKIAVLLLAAHLEGEGWVTRLSLPAAAMPLGPGSTGLDWAACVKAALVNGRPLPKSGSAARLAAYAAASPVPAWERVALRRGLPAILDSLVRENQEYRYEGIWYDTSARIDLVAFHPDGRTMAIEAKGPTASSGGISWSASRAAVRSLFVEASTHPTTGILLPDDRDLAPHQGGMVDALRTIDVTLTQSEWRCYLVGATGSISAHSVAEFAKG